MYGLNASSIPYDGINKYLRITDIDDKSHKLIIDNLTSPNVKIEDSQEYLLKTGDLLFARTGASVGKTYLYNNLDGTVFFAGFLIRMRIKESYNRQFVFQSTLTEKYNNFIKITSQRSGQPGINAKEYSEFNLEVPSKITEQNRLGSLTEKLDALIELYQEKLTLYESLKTYLMLSLFPSNGELVPKVRFNSFQNNWEQVKMINLGKSYSGLSGKSKDDFGHGEARYITYMNIFSNPIANINDLDSIELDNKQNQVKNGDVLFTISSETPEEVGMSSVWLGNSKNTYLNSFCFGFSPTADMNSFYLAFMFRSPSMRRKFMILAQGISRYNISKKRVMSMKIPMTDVREQESIGTIIKSLSDEVTNINSELIYMKKIKKYLLSKLFV